MVQNRILAEYENGCKAIQGEEEWYVVTAEGEKIELEGGGVVTRERKIRLYAALRVQFGDVPLLEEPDAVPVTIAVAGKPAIASYLYVAHRSYYKENASEISGYEYTPAKREIGRVLGVNKSTITKYHNRILTDAEDSKVDGTENWV